MTWLLFGNGEQPFFFQPSGPPSPCGRVEICERSEANFGEGSEGQPHSARQARLRARPPFRVVPAHPPCTEYSHHIRAVLRGEHSLRLPVRLRLPRLRARQPFSLSSHDVPSHPPLGEGRKIHGIFRGGGRGTSRTRRSALSPGHFRPEPGTTVGARGGDKPAAMHRSIATKRFVTFQ